jgi:N-acetylmuramoyl-L-alanine amidase
MADWKGCAAGNYKIGRPGQFQPEAVVIHIMDGTLSGTDSWFNDTRAKVSAHYGIGKAGQVHQYVKEADTAFHAGTVDRPSWPLLKPRVNPNFYTIGIEHAGLAGEPWPWPSPQLQASAKLVREIMDRWGIPVVPERIVPHHLIRAGKTCPDVNFNRAAYLTAVTTVIAPAVTLAPLASALDVTVIDPTTTRSWPQSESAPVAVKTKGQTVRVAQIADGETLMGNAN